MFKYLAENITFLLIKNKIVDIEERDVYVYGLETLLLNISNIFVALIISLISHTLWHFAAFILIFVPLRIFIGGFHAKTSEICLIFTSVVYALTVLIVKLFPLLYSHSTSIIILFIFIIPIIRFAPVEHKNNPLELSDYLRNKLISIVLIAIDSLIFIILRMLKNVVASSIIIFMAIISILVLTGVIVNKMNDNSEKNNIQK